jgi:hypothetical protein
MCDIYLGCVEAFCQHAIVGDDALHPLVSTLHPPCAPCTPPSPCTHPSPCTISSPGQWPSAPELLQQLDPLLPCTRIMAVLSALVLSLLLLLLYNIEYCRLSVISYHGSTIAIE